MLELEELEQRCTPSAAIVGGNLVVDGGSGNDNILVTLGPDTTSVKIGGVEQGPFNTVDVTDHVIVNGYAGLDVIQVRGDLPSELHGGDGNDVLTGGTGKDVIFGDAGNDFIQGGVGDDVLVGGAGQDRITGDGGDDILIGGNTTYDYTSLVAVAFADPGLIASINDTESDRLTGSTGADWFVYSSADTLVDFSNPPDESTLI